MKVGDVSRGRRLSDPARRAYYAMHRQVRFAARMGTSPSRERDPRGLREAVATAVALGRNADHWTRSAVLC